MRYTGMLFYPRGLKLELDMAALSPIPAELAYTIYAQFKREMEQEQFDAEVETGGVFAPMLLRFERVGLTSAYAAFARGANGEATDLEAAVALLTRLDREEDDKLLDRLRTSPSLAGIDPSDWEAAREAPGPLAAAFFTNRRALNDPLIHGLMSLAGAAFLDRLGLLD